MANNDASISDFDDEKMEIEFLNSERLNRVKQNKKKKIAIKHKKKLRSNVLKIVLNYNNFLSL
jgi:hypothetical protein